MILDLRRLTEINSTGASALLELKTRLSQQKKELLLAVADGTTAMERLENFGMLSSIGDAGILPDVDRAIERAENDLLRTQQRLHRAGIPLAEAGVFAHFNAADPAIVEQYLRRVSYWPGDVIFREGDPGNERVPRIAQYQYPAGDVRSRHHVRGAGAARRLNPLGDDRRRRGPRLLCAPNVELYCDGGEIAHCRHPALGCNRPRAEWAAANRQSTIHQLET